MASDWTDEEVGQSSHAVMLINTVAGLAWAGIQRQPLDVVSDLIAHNYAVSRIKEAKAMLWNFMTKNHSVGVLKKIGKITKRSDSENRSEALAHARDIVRALSLLDKGNEPPNIVVPALELQLIPWPVIASKEAKDEGHMKSDDCIERIKALESTMESVKVAIDSFTTKLMKPRESFMRDPPAPVTHDDHPPYTEYEKNFPAMESYASAAAGEWKTPMKRRNPKKSLRGKGPSLGRFTGPPQEIFISQVSKECDVEDISCELKARDIKVNHIEVTSHCDALHKSFKVSVPANDAKSLLSKSFPWPNRVRVREWFNPSRKRRQEREEEEKQDPITKLKMQTRSASQSALINNG